MKVKNGKSIKSILKGVILMTTIFSMADASQKTILVTSFGTSYPETRIKTIEACEKKIAEAFPEYRIKRAFTSVMVRKIIKKNEGIDIPGTGEALDALHKEGVKEVIIQPLHIITGEEYEEKIVQIANGKRHLFTELKIGRPILGNMDDFTLAVKAIQHQIPVLKKNQSVIFMGHGSHHAANAGYAMLNLLLEKNNIQNVYVGTVENIPDIGDVRAFLKKRNVTEVILMPFMLVAGDHAQNDMAGDEEGSWKNILSGNKYNVRTELRGLGENPLIQEMYVQHVRESISAE